MTQALHFEILWLCARFGDGSPGFSWFGVLLVMDVLMCFQADVLLEILRVRVKPGFHYYANAEHKRTQGLAY